MALWDSTVRNGTVCHRSMRWESMCDSVGCAMAWWVNMIMTLCPGRSAARHGDDEPSSLQAWALGDGGAFAGGYRAHVCV